MEVAPDDPPDKTIVLAEGIALHIRYRNVGTRSEGQTGRLMVDGQPIPGTVGDERVFGEVRIRWYGAAGHAWSVQGWNYADPVLIRRSWEQADVSEQGSAAGSQPED